MKNMRIILSVFLLVFIGAIAGYIFFSGEYPRSQKAAKQDIKPKNVIFMIGDGMGFGQMEIARLFEYGKTGKLFMETLPNVAFVHTNSANQFVTDSAAGGTALATGHKTNNEMIGIKPNQQVVDSILDKFKEDGKKVGVITTSSITDATPASFTASIANRWTNQNEIAAQQLENRVDVLLGGGANKFKRTKAGEKDLIPAFKKEGYTYVTDKSELAAAKGEKLLGLFNPIHMNFKIDRDEYKSKEPSLTEMTQKALEFLNQDSPGFFLMVEGARIDHASHSADFTSIWKETIEFDHAVKFAVNWAKKNGDTLVIVTADHETMGISESEPINMKGLKRMEVTPTYIADRLKKEKALEHNDISKVKGILKTYGHLHLSKQETKAFMNKCNNEKGQVYKESQIAWEIGSMIAAHNHAGVMSRENRVLSSTGGHTGNPVPLFSYGKGSEGFEGVLDNVEIPRIIAKLMGYQL
ncbi:alkaline phosphatase [Bacillus massilinigeriensis]|uniref:alkaline phosphatase n=1 Tax=Bacillus massilionigeriensis TaxID=1805475 RepID=UPI000A92BEF5|nr:alkaline phosphatase [Bacillus massilionigeriensis]